MTNLDLRLVAAMGLWLLLGLSSDAGTPEVGRTWKDRADRAARLRAEADSIDVATLSPLFRAILAPGRDAKWPLSAKEVTLTRQCGELTRDILRSWLVRDLDAEPPPSVEVLADRLASARKVRERVVRHAEAIVIEGILPIAEAKRGYAASGRKPEAYLVGRDGPVPLDLQDRSGQSDGDLVGEITMRHSSLDASATSPLTRAVMDRDGRALGGPPAPRPIDLDQEAADLVDRLKSLTRDSLRNWVERGLEGPVPPARSTLLQRVAFMDPVTSSVLAHADAILLEAVLRPDLADEVLRQVWKARKLDALRDPLLAHRIKLTRGQRDALDDLFRQRQTLADEWPFEADLQIRVDAFQAEDGEFDTAIWKGLTAPQARAIRKILNPPKPSTRRALRVGPSR